MSLTRLCPSPPWLQIFASFRDYGAPKTWVARNLALLVAALIMLLATLFLSSLWLQHLWLMATNQTAYEQMKSGALWYLSNVPGRGRASLGPPVANASS